jgi:nitrite reductase/ring-hydroxylating ferredoxin subunit
MLTKEENDLLTQTGPGTPCGDLHRRYWLPAALSEELPPGGAPLPIRLLGEDLVLFRDETGQPGLLGTHCPHRGADLSYGRLEDGGLRCIYHGWLFDRSGRCLEQPGEPAGSTFHERIRQTSYPCLEKVGVIFAYLGPGEPPLLPNYVPFTMPEEHVVAQKMWSACNYLQGNEGNIDLLHTSFLHYIRRDLSELTPEQRRVVLERYDQPETLTGRGPSPGLETVEGQLLPYGVRICKIRKAGEDTYVRLATYLPPALTVIPGGTINWHVPIDDIHHWRWSIYADPSRAIPPEQRGVEWAPAPTYRPWLNPSNRYYQDRSTMRATSYCGIPQKYFSGQDVCATETAGPIQDRTQEHLAITDAPIAATRTFLRHAIKEVEAGREPPHVIRDPAKNCFPEVCGMYGMVPRGLTWKEYADQLAAEAKGWQFRPFRA